MPDRLRKWSGLAVAAAIAITSSAFALDERLEQAKRLFQQHDYLAAQEVLREVRGESLSKDERAEYMNLLDSVAQAIRGAQQSERDKISADQAYDAGKWQEAQRLYQAVVENPYASPDIKEVARVQLGRIAEKLQLSQAAMPSGPVTGNKTPEPARTSPPVRAQPPARKPVETIQVVDVDQPTRTAPRRAHGVPNGQTRKSVYTQPPPRHTTARPPTQGPRRGSSSNVDIETIDLTPNRPAARPASPMAVETVNAAPASPPTAAPADTAPHPLTMVEELRARDDLLWNRAVAKMQEAAQQIDDAIANEDFTEARRLAESAIQIIEANRGYAHPPAKYEEARRMALDLRDWVTRSAEEAAIRKADEQRRKIAEQIQQRREQQEQLRLEKVDQLFNTARQLEKERRFGEAAEAIRQLLSIDPANDKARLALDFYEEFASLAEQRMIDAEAARQQRRVFTDTEAAKIPWKDDVLYPKNWLEISARRDRAAGRGGESEADYELNSRLEEVQPEISFEDQPFEQVVGFLDELNQINMSVDWEDLALAGIQRDKPVTIRLRDVALRTVLSEVLNQVGGDVRLAFSVGDGLVRIATKEKLDRDKFVRVYDIRDLLVRAPDFQTAPRIDLTQTHATNAGANIHSDLFSDAAGPTSNGDVEGNHVSSGRSDGQDNSDQVRQILDIIRQTVEPDSWRENGGGDGALRELNGQLIVYNTSDAQQQIRDLLGQLRRQRALMIAVESRFLTVTSNFLEEIGVDLDFVFNSGNAGFDPAFNNQGAGLFDPFTGSRVLIPRRFSRAGLFPSVPGLGTPLSAANPPPFQPFSQAAFVPQRGGIIPSSDRLTPIGVQQGSLQLVDPTQINTGIPGSISQAANFGPALNLAGSFLDNLQVDFLIRATQANRRSSVVQAPRLMLFNGQRAWVAVTRNRQYVSTVTPTVAEGAVGVTPQPATISSGSSLDVEGTISADRKYVTLTLRIGFAKEPILTRFEVQRQSGNSPGIFITLTDQEQQAVNTTVSVPDGGTVLVGGLKQVGEIDIEAGVPILSKIPVLKRAFTNTTSVKDVQTLLILLKSKIIIQSEAEEEAFPAMQSASAQ